MWLADQDPRTRKDQRRGGNAFTKSTLHLLLTNPVCVGKVRHKEETFPGEHSAIIDKLSGPACKICSVPVERKAN